MNLFNNETYLPPDIFSTLQKVYEMEYKGQEEEKVKDKAKQREKDEVGEEKEAEEKEKVEAKCTAVIIYDYRRVIYFLSFLAAQSSSRSLVVGRSVCGETLLEK